MVAAIRDIVRRHRSGSELPVRRAPESGMLSFQREMNRLFDDFFKGFDLEPFGMLDRGIATGFTPKVDVAETDTEIHVTAELPGMDEKDVTVEVVDNMLTLRGEKKEEHDEKGRDWYRMETSYGSFHRMIPLPAEAEADKAKATFKKGVLSVMLPKVAREETKKRAIEIKAE